MTNCFKCGKELDNNYRCCMSCGAINPNHPENEKTLQYLNNNMINTKNSNNINNNIINETVVTNESSVKNIITLLFFVILNCISFIIMLYIFSQTGSLSSCLIISSILSFYNICYQLLLKKAELPWWGFFIPIYNVYLINKLSFNNGKLFIIPLLPIILIITLPLLKLYSLLPMLSILSYIIYTIYPITLLFCLGRKFGRSGILTVLFPFIIIPTIALSRKYIYGY